ncbi:hypothetical protein J2B92_20515 [Lysinibacillus sphaericus]|uniref:hypothetical protein n=1 Tax=Lysinibacillus sphaericus TaxID=1421 RepID=UPI0018CED3CC|nr:hypothetical protein [Lysinibacillus sphaericus]MBG9754290.1 hypothetical protein [Lysinibacillus sphaericus]QTB13123.1 hypothetical protein J2B92_20515 [Lysinibacillus sphaericus]
MDMIVTAKTYDEKIKKNIKENFQKYRVLYVILSIQLILALVNFILSKSPFLFINENQILYSYATTAQVIAGLYGLTLTGYIFFNDKLNKLAENDDSYYDVVEKLKGQYFGQIILLGIGCILVISMSLITLNTISYFNNPIIYSFLLNQTMIVSITEVVSIVLFSWNMANPKSIEKANEIILKESSLDKKEKGDFSVFLKNYNSIENQIKRITNILNNQGIFNIKYYNKNRKNYQPNIMESLKLLSPLNVIDKDFYHEIDELRRYRNSVVHSEDPVVSQDAVKSAETINTEIKKQIDNYLGEYSE